MCVWLNLSDTSLISQLHEKKCSSVKKAEGIHFLGVSGFVDLKGITLKHKAEGTILTQNVCV